MSEVSQGQAEYPRSLEEAKRFEALQIARLTGVLFEMFNREVSGQDGADQALDDVYNLCESLAERDPDMGRVLIEALESSPEANREQAISDRLRELLGLPRHEGSSLPERDE
jgi:hypothetical protein